MSRDTVNSSTDKRIFKHTVVKTKAANISMVPRGGWRL